MRRNKLALAASAVVLTALLVGLVVAAGQAIRATQAERHQAELRAEAEAARRVAQTAQTGEAKARVLAEQRLYDSLLGQAHAVRAARRVGYRERVFSLLQRTRALVIPTQDLADLRRAASACLGDFVGLKPFTLDPSPGSGRFSLIAVDPTSQVAAFAMSDGSIVLRDLPSGEETGRLQGSRRIRSLSFSATGHRLLSLHTPGRSTMGSLTGSVLVVSSRGPNGRWQQEESQRLPGAFQCLGSSKGHFLAIAQPENRSIQIVDLKDKVELLRFDLLDRDVEPPEIALSPDGRWLALQRTENTEPDGPTLELWNLETRSRTQRWKTPMSEAGPISFSPDGKRLGCLSQSGGILYPTDGSPGSIEFKEYFEPKSQFTFLPAHPVVALPVSQQNRVRLWDCLRNEDFAVLDEPFPPRSAVFSPNGRFLVTAGHEYARIYPLDMSAERLVLSGHARGVSMVDFSPDGARLASVGKERTLKIWDAATATILWQAPTKPALPQCVAYSPDGRWLVTSDYLSASFTLWDANTGQRLRDFGTNAPHAIWSALFSADGRYLATANDGGEIQVWFIHASGNSDAASGPELRLLQRSVGFASWSLVFAPDSRQLAFTQRWDGSPLYIWNFEEESSPKQLHQEVMIGAQQIGYISARQALVVGPKREVVTVDTTTGRPAFSFPTLGPNQADEAATGAALRVSPDGTKLALASTSRRGVDVWDPKTGRLLYTLPDQHGTVWWLAWTPDSRRLAVTGSSGAVAIWNLDEIERVLAKLGLPPADQSHQTP